jgi:hypothetical protein
MTKSVRIENADTNATVKVVVQEQALMPDGSWADVGLPSELTYPTSMSVHGIHAQKRVVVYEMVNFKG